MRYDGDIFGRLRRIKTRLGLARLFRECAIGIGVLCVSWAFFEVTNQVATWWAVSHLVGVK